MLPPVDGGEGAPADEDPAGGDVAPQVAAEGGEGGEGEVCGEGWLHSTQLRVRVRDACCCASLPAPEPSSVLHFPHFPHSPFRALRRSSPRRPHGPVGVCTPHPTLMFLISRCSTTRWAGDPPRWVICPLSPPLFAHDKWMSPFDPNPLSTNLTLCAQPASVFPSVYRDAGPMRLFDRARWWAGSCCRSPGHPAHCLFGQAADRGVVSRHLQPRGARLPAPDRAAAGGSRCGS